jgi:hypothetical protein
MADTNQPAPTAPAPQTGDSGGSAEDVDRLIDSFLGDSEEEHPPKKARKDREPAAPEDEPDEDAADEAAEEDEDTADEEHPDGEEDEDETEEGRFVAKNGKVKLPDGSTATVDELIRGNLRQADYTRKTQELGTLHQEFQARAADYAQQETIVALAIDIMAAALPPEPDMQLLEPGQYNDPIGFTNQKLRWEAASQQLQAMQMAHQQMSERNQQMQATLQHRYALEQKDFLLSKRPELAQRKNLDRFQTTVVKAMERRGFTARDLDTIYDAKVILALEDLGKYDAILDARRSMKRKTEGVPVMAPGTRQSAAGKQARASARDWDQLRKTGGRKGTAGEAALDRVLDKFL